MVFERGARSRGFCRIAGVDEAGRGPLAGPVVAAACILPEDVQIEGINDSKQLLPSQRFAVFQKIVALRETCYGIGVIDALIIDQVNILQATMQAMLLAIAALSLKPDYLLIDGNRMPQTSIAGEAIIEGDARSQSIAAASILAKETRDQMMYGFHQQWPEYGFDEHKGYATKKHIEAIQRFGPCPIHRMTFAPIKNLFNSAVSQ
jgi:ribonuclease HII